MRVNFWRPNKTELTTGPQPRTEIDEVRDEAAEQPAGDSEPARAGQRRTQSEQKKSARSQVRDESHVEHGRLGP